MASQLLPLVGTDQADKPYRTGAPIVESLSLATWRNVDHALACMQPLQSAFGQRTASALVQTSDDRDIMLPASIAAWSAVDWDRDGVREELLLQLSTEEYLRCYDERTGALMWSANGALSGLFEWCEIGGAAQSTNWYWSYANALATGAFIGLRGSGDGRVSFVHNNGVDEVVSTPTEDVLDDYNCRAFWQIDAAGIVQCSLQHHYLETPNAGAASAALARAAWGSGAMLRINELGNGIERSVQQLRTYKAFDQLLTERQRTETI